MTSVITGDITNSRKIKRQDRWMVPLKRLLAKYGNTPSTWEIYRGDSFQLEVKDPADALLTAIKIKACIKSIKELDVRMAIGIGQKSYRARRITQSNGQAFIYSGEKFESLKKFKQTLAIKSPWEELDMEINLMISLASIIMDKWSPISAELINLSLSNRKLSQKEIGKKLGRTQSSISERQKRAHYNEIMDLEAFYRKKVQQQLHVL
ncbi:MAG TPA: SatD family protein [Flavisolibacter sp.]|nr:SatD family protein [Flavisolibacter sp.]